ncbi:PHB depolymerase family esterase [Roseisolibacter sp. H3M3-2]|uniref:PHB depolymerase family esterase n=1 Tax=Roseisolibacter sp. H3M3-2 TaxID=3031323 RepID=UPI0023DA4AF5|nr:PHB depolymerase family esterase [Roseisolibacter sp. H3M3-2]MDF1505503.1 PHB depolymerase family esterase [Roseisolibacter sp. H3M3-2]
MPDSRPSHVVPRILPLAYALACWAAFAAAAVAFVGFLAPLPGWRGVDQGAVTPVGAALLVDLLLVAAFAVPHAVLARAGVKKQLARVVPPAAERATHVLLSSALLLLLVVAWRPVPGALWSVASPGGALALRAAFWLGVATLAASTFARSHAEPTRLDRPWAAPRGRAPGALPFRTPGPYRVVRHPMQLGILLALWATPVLTVGRLALALPLTLCVLVGVRLEERDLRRAFGAAYDVYRWRVPALVPRRAWLALPLALPLLLAAPGAEAPPNGPGLRRLRDDVAGARRTALLYVPPRPAARPAVVLTLHGAAARGALLRAQGGGALERAAGARGFLVAYPDGHARTWNDCRAPLPYAARRDAADEPAFARALVAALVEAHGADPARAYAIGVSNGGHAALRVAVEAPELLASVVAVGASIPDDASLACAPTPGARGLAVPLVAGTDDPVNPYGGGAVRLPTGHGAGRVRSAGESARWLVEVAGMRSARVLALPGVGHALPRRLRPMAWWDARARVDAVDSAVAFFGL